MATQDEFAQRRALQQAMLAKVLTQPYDYKAGDVPAKAWQPAIAQFGLMMQGKRDAAGQKKFADTLADLVGGKQIPGKDPTTSFDDEGNAMPGVAPTRVPYTMEEKLQKAAQVPELQDRVIEQILPSGSSQNKLQEMLLQSQLRRQEKAEADQRHADLMRELNGGGAGRLPPGYRRTAEGMEPIPGGPADQKAQTKAAGGQTVTDVTTSLRDMYNQLDQSGGITNVESDPLSNIISGTSSSGPGQMAGRIFGTKNQSLRNTIAQQRPLLLQAIMKATGMSAKQMDSNTELKLYLSTATDPTLDVQTNKRALDMIEKLYGSGQNPVDKTQNNKSILDEADAILGAGR